MSSVVSENHEYVGEDHKYVKGWEKPPLTDKSIAPSFDPEHVASVTLNAKVNIEVVVKFGPFTQVVSHFTLQLYVVNEFKPVKLYIS